MTGSPFATPASETRPRIALIHALEQSVAPARAAFKEHWPSARCFDLLDTSLSADLAFGGGRLGEPMMQRFALMADYARRTEGEGGTAAGILFTCSAFGAAIDAVKASSAVPVLRPNEAAFEEALALGVRIGLVVTFLPSLAALQEELEAMAAAAGRRVRVTARLAEGALAALNAADPEEHDRLVAEAAAALGSVDVIVLGQFSAARARDRTQALCSAPVITTPHSAVAKLRALVAARSHA